MPSVDVEAMNTHLAEISQRVSVGAIALLVLDAAGWHKSSRLVIPDNIVLLSLPPYAPELNPTENVWEYLRDNILSMRIWNTYEAIVDTCCQAWNFLMATPEVITSIGSRDWACVKIWGGWYNSVDPHPYSVPCLIAEPGRPSPIPIGNP